MIIVAHDHKSQLGAKKATNIYQYVTMRRTVFNFVLLSSIAGLQRSELINVVFDLTTLTASKILLSHTVFIYTTHDVVIVVCSKEKSQICLRLAYGLNADCIVTIVSTARSVTEFNDVSRRRGKVYSDMFWTFLAINL